MNSKYELMTTIKGVTNDETYTNLKACYRRLGNIRVSYGKVELGPWQIEHNYIDENGQYISKIIDKGPVPGERYG